MDLSTTDTGICFMRWATSNDIDTWSISQEATSADSPTIEQELIITVRKCRNVDIWKISTAEITNSKLCQLK